MPGRQILRLAVVAMCMLASLGASRAQQLEKRIALVIGNGAYQALPLPTPPNDAGLIAQTLQAAGFDVVGARDLDAATLRSSVREFVDKASAAGPDAVAVVYFAGYGLQFEGENYLVPVDARITRDAAVPLAAVRLTDLTRPLAAVPLKARIVVVDAARANPFAMGGEPLAGGLALVQPDDGMLIAFNAAPGTVGADGTTAYGAYATALSEMIKEGGLPLDELFERVRLRVSELTNGVDVAWHVSRVKAPFLFFERTSASPSAPPERFAELRSRPVRTFDVRDAYTAALVRDTLPGYLDFLAAYPDDPLAQRVRAIVAARREATTWRETVVIGTPDAYWSYLRRYPRGPHAYDARRRLSHFAVALEPPPAFAAIVYDIPPPPPEEVVYVERPVVYFADPVYALPPPPPVPVVYLPPRPVYFVDLPPPPPPVEAFVLPIPVYHPVPRWVERPAYVAPPPDSVVSVNIHNTVMIDERTQRTVIIDPAGQRVGPAAAALSPAAAAPAPIVPAPGQAPGAPGFVEAHPAASAAIAAAAVALPAAAALRARQRVSPASLQGPPPGPGPIVAPTRPLAPNQLPPGAAAQPLPPVQPPVANLNQPAGQPLPQHGPQPMPSASAPAPGAGGRLLPTVSEPPPGAPGNIQGARPRGPSPASLPPSLRPLDAPTALPAAADGVVRLPAAAGASPATPAVGAVPPSGASSVPPVVAGRPLPPGVPVNAHAARPQGAPSASPPQGAQPAVGSVPPSSAAGVPPAAGGRPLPTVATPPGAPGNAQAARPPGARPSPAPAALPAAPDGTPRQPAAAGAAPAVGSAAPSGASGVPPVAGGRPLPTIATPPGAPGDAQAARPLGRPSASLPQGARPLPASAAVPGESQGGRARGLPAAPGGSPSPPAGAQQRNAAQAAAAQRAAQQRAQQAAQQQAQRAMMQQQAGPQRAVQIQQQRAQQAAQQQAQRAMMQQQAVQQRAFQHQQQPAVRQMGGPQRAPQAGQHGPRRPNCGHPGEPPCR